MGCVGGGGSLEPYDCGGVEYWLEFEAMLSGISTEIIEYLKLEWYEPNCCLVEDNAPTSDAETVVVNVNDSTSAAFSFAESGRVLTVVSTAAVAVLAMAL